MFACRVIASALVQPYPAIVRRATNWGSQGEYLTAGWGLYSHIALLSIKLRQLRGATDSWVCHEEAAGQLSALPTRVRDIGEAEPVGRVRRRERGSNHHV